MEVNQYRQLVAVVALICGGDNQTLIRVTDVSGDTIFTNANVKESKVSRMCHIPVKKLFFTLFNRHNYHDSISSGKQLSLCS
jgi:hypothetical protein